MNELDPVQRRLAAWLSDAAPGKVPARAIEEAIAATGHTRPRPGWLALIKEPPMRISSRVAVGSPILRLASIMAVTIALLVVVGGALVGAASLLPSPAPTGVRNGSIAFDSGGDIFTMDPDGTGRMQLTSGDDLEFGPVWSPDGTRIAFFSTHFDPPMTAFDVDRVVSTITDHLATSVVVMAADGSGRQVLVPGLDLVWPSPLAWSPDGRWLAYAHLVDKTKAGPNATTGIAIMPADGGDSFELAQPGAFPVWSPDGRSVVYSGGSTTTSDVGVYTVGADGSGSRRLTRAEGANGPRWSPDGRRIAYSAGSDLHGDIWLVDADGTNEAAITHLPADENLPDWSPDGRRIAFWQSDRNSGSPNGWDTGHVVFADASGGDLVASPAVGLYPTEVVWAPDGSRVLMCSGDGNPDPLCSKLLSIPADGTADVITFDLLHQLGNASWQVMR